MQLRSLYPGLCDLAVPKCQPVFSPDACTEAQASALQLKPPREDRNIPIKPMCSEQATGVNNRLFYQTQGDIVQKMCSETGGALSQGNEIDIKTGGLRQALGGSPRCPSSPPRIFNVKNLRDEKKQRWNARSDRQRSPLMRSARAAWGLKGHLIAGQHS